MSKCPSCSGTAGCRSDHAQRRSSWADLLPELVVVIAARLLDWDVSEYIRFRAVCRPWRRSTEDPRRRLDVRFRPRHWQMLPASFFGPWRTFLNLVTGTTKDIYLPELAGRHVVGCAEGLLVLHDYATDAMWLLNPLTTMMTNIPPRYQLIREGAITAAGIIDATSPPTVVLCLWFSDIVCAKPGDERWVFVDGSLESSDVVNNDNDNPLDPTLYCPGLSLRGHFYVPTRRGHVLTLDLQPCPRMVLVARQTGLTSKIFMTSYLVPSGDDHARMILVLDVIDDIVVDDDDDDEEEEEEEKEEEEVQLAAGLKVFHVDLAGKRLIPTNNTGDRAVLLGSSPTLSVSTHTFQDIAPGVHLQAHIKDLVQTLF